MLKYVLLATVMTAAVPAFAQDTAAGAQTAPAAPVAPASTAPAQAAPVDPSTAAPADPASTATQSASAATQVAAVVDSEFASYDKDKDGVLNKEEFGAWMVALKSASDPTTKADAPATKTWVGQAFASADKDKSKSISKAELTGFLSQGQS